MYYSKQHKKYGYIVINSNGEILDGIDEYGKPHFTAQYLLQELKIDAMVFQDRYRIPAQITSKLDSSHGILEVKLNTEEQADAEAVLNGRILGSINSITSPTIGTGKIGKSDADYMARATCRYRS